MLMRGVKFMPTQVDVIKIYNTLKKEQSHHFVP